MVVDGISESWTVAAATSERPRDAAEYRRVTIAFQGAPFPAGKKTNEKKN